MQYNLIFSFSPYICSPFGNRQIEKTDWVLVRDVAHPAKGGRVASSLKDKIDFHLEVKNSYRIEFL